MNRSYRAARAVSVAAPAPSPRASLQSRVALLTAGALLASMSVSSLGLLSARADEKSERRQRNYNIAAGALAAGAIYYGVKKRNPIGAAAAGAGAYYAYKKGQKAGDQSRRDRDRFGNRNPFPGNGGRDNYPADTEYGYPTGDPGDYGYGGDYDGGYPVGSPGEDYDGNSYPVGAPGDYGYGRDDYARGDDYPDYGLSGLRKSGANAKRDAKRAPQRSRRIVVK